jgi:hypothetical protein
MCIDEKATFQYFFQLLDEFCQRERTQDKDPFLQRESNDSPERVA